MDDRDININDFELYELTRQLTDAAFQAEGQYLYARANAIVFDEPLIIRRAKWWAALTLGAKLIQEHEARIKLALDTKPVEVEEEPKTYTRESVLDFGKYKGASIGSILITNPGYLDWLIKNVPRFNVEEELGKEISTLSNTVRSRRSSGWWYRGGYDDYYDPDYDCLVSDDWGSW